MMKELMMNEDFSDITLVTEDKQHIKANVNILCACSPVFKEILKKERNSTQIMYLRGIQFSEIESIMQFIYLGEATFYEERMDEFLAVAKSLEIKELCNAETEKNDEPDDEPSHPIPETSRVEEQNLGSDQIIKEVSKEKSREVIGMDNKYECAQCHKTYSSSSNLYHHKKSAHEGVKYSCDQCDHQATDKSNLTRHIKRMHKGGKIHHKNVQF